MGKSTMDSNLKLSRDDKAYKKFFPILELFI